MGGCSVLVELVMGEQSILDIEVFEEHSRGSGIFCQDHVGLFQYSDGAKGHVLHVSHRCGDDIQDAHSVRKYSQ